MTGRFDLRSGSLRPSARGGDIADRFAANSSKQLGGCIHVQGVRDGQSTANYSGLNGSNAVVDNVCKE